MINADYLEILKAFAVVIAFVAAIFSFIGLIFISFKYQYLRYTKKTYVMAFFTGPFVWLLGDKDTSKFQAFKLGMKVLLPLFIVSAIVLVSLTM